MELLHPYLAKITFTIFNRLVKKDEYAFAEIQRAVHERMLEEVEAFIRDNLDNESLRQGYEQRLAAAVENDDEEDYKDVLLTYLQLIPDMQYLLDRRMEGLEVTLMSKFYPMV